MKEKAKKNHGSAFERGGEEDYSLFFDEDEQYARGSAGSSASAAGSSSAAHYYWVSAQRHRRALFFNSLLVLVVLLLIVLFVLFAVYDHQSSVRRAPLVVHTEYGAVHGFYAAANNSRVFLGVPFAAPPVGALRWKSPHPPSKWQGVRNATAYGPVCPQVLESPILIQDFPVSEDCLYLNVFTPKEPADHKLPVMLWIYGGGFDSGSANLYDGTALAAEDTIVVTFNYRLGPFGFLALPELKHENMSMPTGFYGIEDQRAAMQWVKNNIAAFGGDPERITIFGESAGAISTCIHMVANKSADLFQQALMQSGFCNVFPISEAYVMGAQFKHSLNCNTLSCLRNKTIKEVMDAVASASLSFTFWPVLDPAELSQQPNISIQQGKLHSSIEAFLIGTTNEENAWWLCSTYADMTEDQYRDALLEQGLASSAVDEVMQLYPVEAYDHPVQALIAATSDGSFKCPSLEVAVSTSRISSSVSSIAERTWMYSFDIISGLSLKLGQCYKAAHSMEIFFLFPKILHFVTIPYTMSHAEHELSSFMIRSWTNFAKNGDPNSSTFGTKWPTFHSENNYIRLNKTLTVETEFRSPNCEFWNAYGPLN
ncbi:Neuroligin 2b [Balamuthia mandrillaris]